LLLVLQQLFITAYLIRTQLFDTLRALRTIIFEEKKNAIFVNVSVGSKIQAIASMMACMMFKDEVNAGCIHNSDKDLYAELTTSR
jgi:hypothetical protein